MKKDKKQLKKFESLLSSAKNDYQDDFKTLFFVDLKNLLNEFFVLSTNPTVDIEKVENKSKIKIEFTATAIKTFSFIKSEEVNY